MSEIEYTWEQAVRDDRVTFITNPSEEMILDRKKAIYALRTGDESQRCTGSVFRATGQVCAIGQMLKGLGYGRESFLTYAAIQDKLGISNVSPIYILNDSLDGSKITKNMTLEECEQQENYCFTWNDIADRLAEAWGIDA